MKQSCTKVFQNSITLYSAIISLFKINDDLFTSLLFNVPIYVPDKVVISSSLLLSQLMNGKIKIIINNNFKLFTPPLYLNCYKFK